MERYVDGNDGRQNQNLKYLFFFDAIIITLFGIARNIYT